jgi:putative transposase
MSRLRRMLLTGRIIFITAHVLPPLLPLTPSEYDTILLAIADARDNRKFALLGYLMMPSHLHLLLAPAQSDTLSAILREIKITASKRIHPARKTTGAFWQPRSFDRIIRSRAIFEKALLYLHLNPVEASLRIAHPNGAGPVGLPTTQAAHRSYPSIASTGLSPTDIRIA